jgi:hypothetical protein
MDAGMNRAWHYLGRLERQSYVRREPSEVLGLAGDGRGSSSNPPLDLDVGLPGWGVER